MPFSVRVTVSSKQLVLRNQSGKMIANPKLSPSKIKIVKNFVIEVNTINFVN